MICEVFVVNEVGEIVMFFERYFGVFVIDLVDIYGENFFLFCVDYDVEV